MKFKREIAFKIIWWLQLPIKIARKPFYLLAILFVFINDLLLIPEEWLRENFLWDLQGEPRELNERLDNLFKD